MSYQLFIKFAPNLGPDAIATDYSVLGEENFQKILDFCDANPPKTYLTREDLGGIGLVDYLIVPTSFFAESEYKIGAFQEKDNVYYLPLNILALSYIQNLLSAYHQEVDSKEIIDKFKSSLFDNLSKWSDYQDGFLITINTIYNHYDSDVAFKNYKREMLESFPTIICNRVDLIFTDQQLRYHILYFLTKKGIKIDPKDIDLDVYFPVFLRYMAKLNPRKAKEYLSIKDQREGFRSYLAPTIKNGDVVLSHNGVTGKELVYANRNVQDLIEEPRYNYPRIFDSSTKTSYREHLLGTPIHLEVVNYEGRIKNLSEQKHFIQEQFFKGRFSELLSQKRILGAELRIHRLEEKTNFKSILSYIYINEQGFISLETDHLEVEEIINAQLYFLFLDWADIIKYPNRDKGEGFSLAFLRKKDDLYRYLGVATKAELEKGLLTLDFDNSEIIQKGSIDGKYGYAYNGVGPEGNEYLEKSGLVRLLEESTRFITMRHSWNFREYFDKYKSTYNKFFNVLEKALTESYRYDGENAKSLDLVFNTIDQSLVCKVDFGNKGDVELFRVNRDGEYAIAHMASDLYGLHEEDVTDFYIAFIKHLFSMQKEVVDKYGMIEYQIELKLPLHYSFDNLLLPTHSVDRNIFLLSDSNEKLHIINDKVWFEMD